MLETFLITLREGLESFLIVAMTAAYLRNTGRTHLLPAVWWGVGAAIVTSIGAGYWLTGMEESELMEGTLALIAGAMVASMTVMVMRAAKTIRQDMTAKIESHASKTGFAAIAGLFAFTLLMVSREGMETAMMIGAQFGRADTLSLLVGAALGLFAAVEIGFLWIAKSHLVNLRRFLQTTGVFLVLFALHLMLYGLHEVTEHLAVETGNPAFTQVHEATEIFGHDSLFAQILTYSIIVLPLGWLGIGYVRDRAAARYSCPSAT